MEKPVASPDRKVRPPVTKITASGGGRDRTLDCQAAGEKVGSSLLWICENRSSFLDFRIKGHSNGTQDSWMISEFIQWFWSSRIKCLVGSSIP